MGKFHTISIKKQISPNIVTLVIKNGHIIDILFFSTHQIYQVNDYRGEKKNNNNKKSRNKNKNKRTLLSWKDNINYEEQSNSVLNSDIII